MKKTMVVLMIVGLVLGLGGVARAGVIADSDAEFQTAPKVQPVQGFGNWYYGYWDEPTGGYVIADYNATTDFTVEDPMAWNTGGPAGRIYFDDPPSSLTMCQMYHDGAAPYGPGQWPGGRPSRWPIRRWVAEVTGSVLIHGELQVGWNYEGNKWATDATGIIARFFRNGGGDQFFTQVVPASQPPHEDVINYSVSVDVAAGDLIDFMLDGDPSCAGDWTHWTIVIEHEPVVPEPAGLGLMGLVLLAVRKRRS